MIDRTGPLMQGDLNRNILPFRYLGFNQFRALRVITYMVNWVQVVNFHL